MAQTKRPAGSGRGFDLATLPIDTLAGFCQEWRIRELALFGSALRGNLRDDSDVDFLVTFADDADWSLLDHLRMEEELERIVGRKVDLVSRAGIERSTNWLRRREILSTARTVYAA